MLDRTVMDHRSRFSYGADVDNLAEWSSVLPVHPWDLNTPTVGGSAIAASGLPASYLIRSDHLLALTLRFVEDEWTDVVDLISWGQLSEAIRWYPDANLGDSFLVYLHTPAAGEPYAPQRTDFPGVLEITLHLRRVDGGVWDLPFFPC